MKENTQRQYFDTLINTLRIELKNEMASLKNGSNGDNYLNEEVNALDLLIK